MNSSSTSSTLSTVAVIGANGKTGRKIVELLVNSNISTLALTRDGLFNPNQLQLHIDNINMDKLKITYLFLLTMGMITYNRYIL